MSLAYTSNNHFKYTYPNPLFQLALTLFKRKLRELVIEAQPTTVLDAGCGEGFILEYLSVQCLDTQFVGIDLAKNAVMYAQEHCVQPFSFAVGDLCRLPFACSSFDLLICSEVLEHLAHVEPAIEELKRVARQYVLVSVPLEPYFQAVARVVAHLGLAANPDHIQFWSRQSFRELMFSHFPKVTFRYTTLYQLALAQLDKSVRGNSE